MARPEFLMLRSVKCEAMDDTIGSDFVYGLLGPRKFTIGSFTQGTEIAVDMTEIVPSGVTTLQVFEEDATGDDLLGEVDLTQEMDADRVVALFSRNARYVLRLNVQSRPE
jgi:hypothetical protein